MTFQTSSNVGSVDAIGVSAPYTTKVLERSGSKVLFSSEDYPAVITDNLVISRKLIKEPQVVQALVKSWYETLQYLEAKPEEAYKIMAKRAGVTVDEYRAYEVGIKLFGIEESVRAFESGNQTISLVDAATQISKFLMDNGLIKKLPDLNKLFAPQFVKNYAAHK